MPVEYVCRKCNKTYVQQYYNRNKFCEVCGSFLIENRKLDNYLDETQPANQTNFQPYKIEENKTFQAPSKQLIGIESTRTIDEDGCKRIITYSDPNNIRKLIENNQFSSFDKFILNLKAREIKSIGSIDRLLSIDFLRTKLDPYPFQMRVALSVLQEMNANAILADEVGLGKTIEAGLILKELIVRGIVSSILIIVPKSLMKQWKDEMLNKFGERFIKTNDPEFVSFETDDKVICSSSVLVRRSKDIEKKRWDLVIVDEAHTFRNLRSKGRESLARIHRHYLLLLSATPLCNKLTDLYSLVDLISPGMLGTERAFVSRYAADSKCRVIRSDMVDSIRTALEEVMCRTRRIDTDIPFTQRFVESRKIQAKDIEYQFIDEATQYLKDIGNNRFKTIEELQKENPTINISNAKSEAILIFQAISMQQSLSSSPYAAIESLNKRFEKYPSERQAISRLVKLAEQITIAI